jgi:hypothetical protein
MDVKQVDVKTQPIKAEIGTMAITTCDAVAQEDWEHGFLATVHFQNTCSLAKGRKYAVDN